MITQRVGDRALLGEIVLVHYFCMEKTVLLRFLRVENIEILTFFGIENIEILTFLHSGILISMLQ